MKSRILALLTLALAACGTSEPDMPSGEARPPMWVVYDADTRIVMLGSVHQLPDDLEWTGGRLAVELPLARELLLELAPEESERAASLFAALAGDEPVPGTAARFGDSAAEVRRLAGAAGIAPAQAERTESWALALAAGNALSQGHGLSPDHGVEAVLTARFRGNDLPVRGLETARAQLDMFDTLSPAQQILMVRAVLDDADDSVTRTRRLLAAWATNDIETLTAITQETVTDTPFLAGPMIHARNRAWAAALQQRLEQPGDVLVAVGVGHLVGEGSLLDELRARGLRPMRLQ